MAYAESQPTVSLTAATTFSNSDLYKFVEVNTAGKVVIGTSTGIARVFGTLLSETYSTSTAANEIVTVGLLQGIGQVRMAGSTAHVGNVVSASSDGYGIAPTTNSQQFGVVVDGTGSSSTGRIYSVLFGTYNNL